MTAPRFETEKEIVLAFFQVARQQRWLEMLGSVKGRRKLTATLPHLRHLDESYIQPIPPSAQTASGIAVLLRRFGASNDCYVWSFDREIDGREMPLDEALEAVVGRAPGTLISCLPGRLVYHEGEGRNERNILRR